jgi:hypothetical protein
MNPINGFRSMALLVLAVMAVSLIVACAAPTPAAPKEVVKEVTKVVEATKIVALWELP